MSARGHWDEYTEEEAEEYPDSLEEVSISYTHTIRAQAPR